MRHAIVVVGSDAQRPMEAPAVRLLDDETVRQTTWFACGDQNAPNELLDEAGIVSQFFKAPVLAYRFYLLVQNTKLWSGKRPLVLIRGRSLSSRIAAYAGSWGGGDIVKADADDGPPLGPTRFFLQPDGKLELRDN